MRLGVSNLAWAAADTPRALALLAARGVDGIEVAPTRIAEWPELTATRVGSFRDECRAAGLKVASLQAIFFGRPEALLLGDESGFAAMAEHFSRIGGIAAELGAKIAVFGAPRNRARGERPAADALALAAERLRVLGDIAAAARLSIGMEPVPPRYGADFLNHAREVVGLVRACGHPNVRAHLDSACVTLAGDDLAEAIREAAPWLAHYHAAEPDLGGFEQPQCDHALAARTLRSVGYDRWVVIEMRENQADALGAVAKAVEFVQAAYF